jgi:hypothetical protein
MYKGTTTHMKIKEKPGQKGKEGNKALELI